MYAYMQVNLLQLLLELVALGRGMYSWTCLEEFFAARKLVTLWSVHNFKGELGNQAQQGVLLIIAFSITIVTLVMNDHLFCC